MLKPEDQALWTISSKGLVNIVLTKYLSFWMKMMQLYSREIHKEKMMLEVFFLHLCRVSKTVTHQHPTLLYLFLI